MLIIAGALMVDARDRERYMAAVEEVAGRARRTPGCLDFVQAPDLIDPTRINVYERWASDEDLERFRASDDPLAMTEPDMPEVTAATVATYRVTAVE